MTKIIGLTGGIGSGKTTIAKYLESLGIPVYIADEEAKKILQSKKVISKIKTLFGEKVIIENKIDKKTLAQIVFNDSEKLQALNAIIHPEVKKHFSKWIKQHIKEPFVIKEAAILFESGSYKDCDKILCVVAPIEIRIKRVMDRDAIDRNTVIDRIKNQWTDEQRIENSDFVVENIDLNKAKAEINNILKVLRKL